MAIKPKTEYKITCFEDMIKIEEACSTTGLRLDEGLLVMIERKDIDCCPVWYLSIGDTVLHGYPGNGRFKRIDTLKEFLNIEEISYQLWL